MGMRTNTAQWSTSKGPKDPSAGRAAGPAFHGYAHRPWQG